MTYTSTQFERSVLPDNAISMNEYYLPLVTPSEETDRETGHLPLREYMIAGKILNQEKYHFLFQFLRPLPTAYHKLLGLNGFLLFFEVPMK